MMQKQADVLSAAEPRSGVPSWLEDVHLVVVGATIPLETGAGVLAQFGARLTRVMDLDGIPVDADVVLADRIQCGGDVLGHPVEYLRRVGETNRAVWVTASAYGMHDPRVSAKASEVTLLAAGGILGHTPGPGGLPPTIPAGDVALKLVGNVLAMAALHGLQVFRTEGRPVHIDLSAQGAVIATGLALEMSHALNDCPNEGGTARYGAPTGFFPCRDGSVYVLLLEQHQWVGFRGLLSPQLDHVETVDDAAERAQEVNAALARWTRERTVAECEKALQDAGVPATTVHTVESFYEAAEAAGRPADPTVPLPAAMQLYRETEGTRRHIPLPDLKVLDAGHVLAVPLSAAWLGAMGAKVTKAEDPRRLDIYRRRGPFAKGIPGLNRSAYFNHLNFSKQGLDIEVDLESSSLDIESFDVIMHNLSPHRAALLGVDPDSVGGAQGQARLSLVSSGFGRTGAWQDYRAYGTTIHAFAGLISATRNANGDMSGIGTPWADPLCSVSAAIWALAWSLAPARSRTISVDISMAETLAAHLVDQIGVQPEANYLPRDHSYDFFLRLPASGTDLAVTIESIVEEEAFAEVVGVPVPEISWRGQRVELPRGPLSALSDGEIESRFQAVGIRASLVYAADGLARDQCLFDSEVFQFVESEALGRYAVAGLPWSLIGERKRPLTAAPERP